MTRYAEQATTHLDRAARALNDDATGLTPAQAAWMRLRLAEAYIRLAAVEKGLPPGCACHGRDTGPI